MFSGFFYALRDEGVPISLYEWMTLMEALSYGLANNSLTDFYYLARSVLVKSETYFDKYDAAFMKHFNKVSSEKAEYVHVIEMEKLAFDHDFLPQAHSNETYSTPMELLDALKKLEIEVKVSPLDDGQRVTDEEKASGSSTLFGNNSGGGGGGVRIGGETSGMSAVKTAGKRRYKDYQDDSIRNIRQFETALRTLRQLSTKLEGPKDELDLDATIDETGNNAMLTLVWNRPRKNAIKVLVLMDSIGSIYSYHDVCKKLFNAAHRSTHFKEIKFFYFHNCIYGRIYKNQWLDINESFSTDEFFRLYNSDYRVLIVGDAKMAPSELFDIGGIISWSAEYNAEAGVTWLSRIARHFPYCVWLNPVPEYLWRSSEPKFETISIVGEIFPMFELTPAGITKAVKKLRAKSK
jgi:uncharacterized protein with von Willebrand factor type A (vWA) domain